MEQRVSYLVRQSGELLGRTLARKQRDLSRRALPLRGINRVGIFKLNAALYNEVLQPFRVPSGITLSIAKFGKRLTVGVGYIKHIDRAETYSESCGLFLRAILL